MNEFANAENILRTTKGFPSSRKNLYQVLGLSRGAKAADIRRAYHRLARKLHPDLRPGDEAAERAFKVVNAAYEVLSDATKRQAYDAWASARDDLKAAGRRRFFRQQAIVFTAAFAISSGAFVGTLIWLRQPETPGASHIARNEAAQVAARVQPRASAAADLADRPAETNRVMAPEQSTVPSVLRASSGPSDAQAADGKADYDGAMERARHDAPAVIEPAGTMTAGIMTAGTGSSGDSAALVIASNSSESFDTKMVAVPERERPGMRLPDRIGEEDRGDGLIEPPSTFIETASIPTSRTRDTPVVSAKRPIKPEQGNTVQDRAAKARKPAGERGPKLEGSGGRTIVAEERAISAPRPQVAANREPRFQTADEPFVDPVGINK